MELTKAIQVYIALASAKASHSSAELEAALNTLASHIKQEIEKQTKQTDKPTFRKFDDQF